MSMEDIRTIADLYDAAHFYRRAFSTHEAIEWALSRGLISQEERDSYYLTLWG